jgi:hypothetical protein
VSSNDGTAVSDDDPMATSTADEEEEFELRRQHLREQLSREGAGDFSPVSDTGPNIPGVNCKSEKSTSKVQDARRLEQGITQASEARGSSSNGDPPTSALPDDGSGGSSGTPPPYADPPIAPNHEESDDYYLDPLHYEPPFQPSTDYSSPDSTWQEWANEQLVRDGRSDKGKAFKPLPEDRDRSSNTRIRKRNEKMIDLKEQMIQEENEHQRKKRKQEDDFDKMRQEAERDHNINRARDREKLFDATFMSDMNMRNEIGKYLGNGQEKESSEDEPTDLTLSDEEWLTRTIRHDGAESQITAIRAVLMELGQDEEDIREWLLRHHNER